MRIFYRYSPLHYAILRIAYLLSFSRYLDKLKQIPRRVNSYLSQRRIDKYHAELTEQGILYGHYFEMDSCDGVITVTSYDYNDKQRANEKSYTITD